MRVWVGLCHLVNSGERAGRKQTTPRSSKKCPSLKPSPFKTYHRKLEIPLEMSGEREHGRGKRLRVQRRMRRKGRDGAGGSGRCFHCSQDIVLNKPIAPLTSPKALP